MAVSDNTRGDFFSRTERGIARTVHGTVGSVSGALRTFSETCFFYKYRHCRFNFRLMAERIKSRLLRRVRYFFFLVPPVALQHTVHPHP